METTQKCVGCGMPMVAVSDFAGADTSKDYCKHCAKPDGSMQNYEEKLDALAGFIAKNEALNLVAARGVAASRMAKLPAWQGRVPAPRPTGSPPPATRTLNIDAKPTDDT